MIYKNPIDWRRAVVNCLERARREGGDFIPSFQVKQMKDLAMKRGLHIRITQLEGVGGAIFTVLESDGLPCEAHGGPRRIAR